MRQIGILCAPALVAVQENVKKLEDDHKQAKQLAGYTSSFVTTLYLSTWLCCIRPYSCL